MDDHLLARHIEVYKLNIEKDMLKYQEDKQERDQMVQYYTHYNIAKMQAMKEDDIYEYISKLWAMLIWGNKHYVVDKIIDDNGLQNFKDQLIDLVWGKNAIEKRWNDFRKNIKGMGPAMISEILCKSHPSEFMIWNRRAFVGMNHLEIEGLPRYDYQITGKVYKSLCEKAKEIAQKMKEYDLDDRSLLAVDYFIWHELQVEDNLSKIKTNKSTDSVTNEKDLSKEKSPFVHNDIRDKIRDIGEWLGFTANIEKKVASGSVVDVIWESKIGNMGQVIYVFEVQTKGNIDSLIINLLKTLNNPSVQGVVAVSDMNQIEKIKSHSTEVKNLFEKLKYWDYEQVLKVHENLEFVNGSINNLGLVPDGF